MSLTAASQNSNPSKNNFYFKEKNSCINHNRRYISRTSLVLRVRDYRKSIGSPSLQSMWCAWDVREWVSQSK
jgi:hypothetical protein